ncbi:hypothetical protein A2230_09305 [candidate division WOR-1 bacterium RIFOXYA2_FULL_36_21]|uniref:Bacterial surface antigen (D15) domain-containing protein n=1 Tax=candidate division WOR-1 bacterium RIFOXYB2_FULL_36_35 TaxID=1802578 RepID=A0A1F4S3Q1_UNCSA|nr:MAG: hypothetical protein A2230_09305 [candidate division WOR-1 bacterium RIFOXYA2_FULL_36_21]OGC15052.1 MAG: hypothetical protein A2290_09125 [candidate division WOR-1 bacterium RIFOXYB2_FULL_36_35]OGC16434.1 MAG: hypothetical protein A2282_03230 [candidate division WOR-1 bacterium RIFOXYA12_FULL_36_13]
MTNYVPNESRRIKSKFRIILISGFWVLFGFWVLSFGFPCEAATSIDPSLKWKTLETLHFKINYYDKLEPIAYKLASIAEEVHLRLSPLFRHTPDLKTDVVLLDNTDYTNGFTTVLPNPLIYIFVANMDSNAQPFSYDDWLHFVFVHEYTHLLHLDTVEGSTVLFKMLLGRSFFPNFLNPLFIIEGIAVYEETKFSKGGRLDDPRWQACLRMEALSKDMKSIQQASVSTVRWPMGNVAYLYGSSFIQYLANTYGEEKIYRLSQEYGDYVLSYGIDMAFSNIFGKTLWVLWKDWEEDLIKKSEEKKKNIEKETVTSPKILTHTGYFKAKPVWRSNSSKIYYTSADMDDSSRIKCIDVKTGEENKILEGILYDDSMTINGDILYFTKGDIYKNYYYFKDIYSLNLKTGSQKRLTEGARASDPAISPDGEKIVFVRNNLGTKSLWIMNSDGSGQRKFTASNEEEQYLSPKFSPDGEKIAVAKWVKGKQKIVFVDVNTGIEKLMTTKKLSIEGNPSFSPDGKYLLFESDASSVPNIYAFNLKTSEIYKITNVLGMAGMPNVSSDVKKIAYINYTEKGCDLALIDFDPSSWKKINFDNKKEEYKSVIETDEARVKDDVVLKKYDYNPLPSFLPKFWFPYSYSDENGDHMLAYTAGIDVLGQQYSVLQFGYDWTARRPTYSFIYNNDQFLPQLTFTAGDVAYSYLWDSDTKTYWEREQNLGAYLSLYDNRFLSEFDRQSVSVGYEYNNLSNISSLEGLSNQPTLGKLGGYFAAYRYNSLRSFGYSVAPEGGVSLSIATRLYSKDAGSDYNLTSYTISGSTYHKMFTPHHVLGLSATGNINYGDSFVQSGFSYKNISVRGYPYNYISGSKSAKGSIQYIFPVGYPENGFGYGYLFLDRIYGKFFYDQVGATFGSASIIDWKRTIGAELGLSTINGWGMFPVSVNMGYAKGLDQGGEDEIYFTFSM